MKGRAVLAALVCGFSVAAWAENPHWIFAEAFGPDGDGNLIVSFKIAGLGNTVTTTVTASADATALYACLNTGVSAEVSGPVSTSGDFTSGKNGEITASLRLSPPASTLGCPSTILLSVTYCNVEVFEPSAGTRPIPGCFSRVLVVR
jgi:hypothetical protein